MEEEELGLGCCGVNENCWEETGMPGSELAHTVGQMEALRLGYVR